MIDQGVGVSSHAPGLPAGRSSAASRRTPFSPTGIGWSFASSAERRRRRRTAMSSSSSPTTAGRLRPVSQVGHRDPAASGRYSGGPVPAAVPGDVHGLDQRTDAGGGCACGRHGRGLGRARACGDASAAVRVRPNRNLDEFVSVSIAVPVWTSPSNASGPGSDVSRADRCRTLSVHSRVGVVLRGNGSSETTSRSSSRVMRTRMRERSGRKFCRPWCRCGSACWSRSPCCARTARPK